MAEGKVDGGPMGNLCEPLPRVHREREGSSFKPNGYAFGADVGVRRASVAAFPNPGSKAQQLDYCPDAAAADDVVLPLRAEVS